MTRNGVSRPVESSNRRSSSPGRAASRVAGGSTSLSTPARSTDSDWRFFHSASSSPRPVNGHASNAKRNSDELGFLRGIFLRAGHEVLVSKRGHDRDDRDAKQRADAIQCFESREIVEEQFQQGHAQQGHRRIPARADAANNADEKEA